MLEQVKLIAARKTYEFRSNELRLTMLSLAKVRDRIQELFEFDTNEVQTPPAVFDTVPVTMPPGVVFQVGGTSLPDGAVIPIRFLHFEPRRIVIDVSGPSSAIDYVFDRLKAELAEVRTPDGSPALGEPWRVWDYSELSVRMGFGLDKLFDQRFLDYAKGLFSSADTNRDVRPLGLRLISPDGPGGAELPDIYTLEFGDADQLENEIYTSRSDSPTDQHLAWLEALEQQIR